MRFISTRAHGVLDYTIGILLMLAPKLFGFNYGGAETWVPIILGASTILYSLLTDYELGMVRAIPMRGHLTLDFLSGALLAVSPWLFGFSEVVSTPHVVVGVLEMGAALMTQKAPSTTANMTKRAGHA